MFSRSFFAVVGTAALLSGPAFASVSYDTNLINPPGTDFGTDNPNVHWTVNNSSGVEIGLNTLIRYLGPTAPQAGSSTYNVPVGDTTVAGKHGSDWGYVFSINAVAAQLTLSQLTTSLSIFDTVHNTTLTFDPLNDVPDNTYYGPTGRHTNTAVATDYAFQNSEAFSFTNGNNAIDDTYLITLSASCNATCVGGSGLLGTQSETVVVGNGAPAAAPVPEPASLALLGAGLVCLGSYRRFRRS